MVWVDDSLWTQAKIQAIRNNVLISRWVEAAIKDKLERESKRLESGEENARGRDRGE